MGVSLGGEAKGEASSAKRQWGTEVMGALIENTISDVPDFRDNRLASINSNCGQSLVFVNADLFDGGDCQPHIRKNRSREGLSILNCPIGRPHFKLYLIRNIV